MSLIDQTFSSQTKSLWHQRAFLLLWIASSTGYKDFSWSTQPTPIAVCS